MNKVAAATENFYHVQVPRVTDLGDEQAVLDTMAHVDLYPDSYFVIGGANMVLRGVKRVTEDIDMLVSTEAYNKLSGLDGAELHSPPPRALARGAANTTVWVRNHNTPLPLSATTELGDGYYPLSFVSHLHETEMVQGVRCIKLSHVLESKKALQRPKDIADIAAIACYTGETVELPKPLFTNAKPYYVS